MSNKSNSEIIAGVLEMSKSDIYLGCTKRV
ncbi:hypothetical protein U975_02628 [Staphylococcus aureus 2393-19]|nr:hypothetical protein U974_02648 [Staphylococcus aureus 2393-15]EZW08603.1 hypothetical protein U975_02628 [Staphylococcus aureus 2393-19]EZW89999.1 hypothetical protein U949_00545 [Staphylococcus aureus 87807-1]